MNKRSPFLAVLFFVSLGIYSQSLFFFSFTILLSSAIVVLLILIFLIITKNPYNKVCLHVLFIALGALCYYLQIVKFMCQVRCCENRCLTVIGKVIDKNYADCEKTQELIIIKILFSYERNGKNIQLSGNNMLLHLYKNTDLQVDDVIQGYGIFIGKQGNFKSNEFLRYLCKEGLLAYVFKRGNFYYKLIKRPSFSLKRYIWDKKQFLYTNIMKKLSNIAQSYFSLIFLGNKKQAQESTKLRKRFGECGLSHCLARSGLHIVFFILFLQIILQCVPIPLWYKRLFLMFIVIIYNLLTWSSISFARAYNVFLLMQLGHLFGRPVVFTHLLTFVCLMFILFNPLQLFALDFQLSFGLTFILSYSALLLRK